MSDCFGAKPPLPCPRKVQEANVQSLSCPCSLLVLWHVCRPAAYHYSRLPAALGAKLYETLSTCGLLVLW